MNVKGEHTFPAPRATTFALLTDPEVLKAVLPGCEEFTEVGEGAYRVVLTVNLIAFAAKVTGDVEFSDLTPPESYRVRVTGSGSLGSLDIGLLMRLTEAAGRTVLAYDVGIEATGALGAMGPVILQPAASMILGQVMGALEKEIEKRAPAG